MFAQRGARSWKGLEKRRQLIDPSQPSGRCCAFAMAVPLQRGSLGRSHAASREQEREERPGVPGGSSGWMELAGMGWSAAGRGRSGGGEGRQEGGVPPRLADGAHFWYFNLGFSFWPFVKSSDLMMRLFFL